MKPLLRALGMATLALTVGMAALAGAVPARTDTITYGLVGWNPLHWLGMVGGAKGQFERQGIKLDIPIMGSSGAAVQAMIGGSLQMTTTSPGAAFLAQDKAPDMKQIIGIYDRTPYSLVVNPEIKSIADLKGKVLGGTGVKTGAGHQAQAGMR